MLSQGITARLVERFGALRVLTAGMATAVAGLLLFSHRRAGHRVLPDDLLGLLRDRARHRQRVHAAADDRDGRRPAADAGLGSGITNVSQQISGALGLAVLSTIATNHTQATGSLLAGYHLAFTIGAASVAVGLLAALVLLRPRQRELAAA